MDEQKREKTRPEIDDEVVLKIPIQRTPRNVQYKPRQKMEKLKMVR